VLADTRFWVHYLPKPQNQSLNLRHIISVFMVSKPPTTRVFALEAMMIPRRGMSAVDLMTLSASHSRPPLFALGRAGCFHLPNLLGVVFLPGRTCSSYLVARLPPREGSYLHTAGSRRNTGPFGYKYLILLEILAVSFSRPRWNCRSEPRFFSAGGSTKRGATHRALLPEMSRPLRTPVHLFLGIRYPSPSLAVCFLAYTPPSYSHGIPSPPIIDNLRARPLETSLLKYLPVSCPWSFV